MLTENRQIYAKQAKAYAQVTYWGFDEQVIVNTYFKGKDVLVMGCGGGRTLLPIYTSGFDITAIDIVPEMVTEATSRMEGYPIRILLMDASDLTFPDSTFDTVFFPFHGIDYVAPDVYKAVSEASRVLKSDGVFVFSSHNRLYLKKLHRYFMGSYDYYHGLHTYRTSPRDVKKLKKYFRDVSVVHKINLLDRQCTNWKDRLYQYVPWLSKTTYFVCSNPFRHD